MIQTVNKETLGQRDFAIEEVLSKQHQIEMRRIYLNRALTLGNLFHHKISITYLLRNQERQRVNTTVWSVSQKHVTLKGGLNIPIHAIEEVDLV